MVLVSEIRLQASAQSAVDSEPIAVNRSATAHVSAAAARRKICKPLVADLLISLIDSLMRDLKKVVSRHYLVSAFALIFLTVDKPGRLREPFSSMSWDFMMRLIKRT